MKSLLASVRASGGFDRVDHAVQLLEDDWRKRADVPLERHWAEQRRHVNAEPGESLVLLTELIKTDLRCRFARGQSPTIAGYLDRFPELEAADSRVLSLIYEEFCLAEERGDRIDVDAFCDRYPRWKESLVSQLQYHHLFSQAAGARPKSPPFPEAGDTFEEFELASLLGRGGTSRVFLARDLSLGGKQVVLKVSLDRGREPQAQGALDHPHIVPVNSVVFGEEGMRGLSMPYRPGLPLDEVVRRADPASRPRSAMALWAALSRGPEAEATEGATAKPEGPPGTGGAAPRPKGDGWEGFPVRGTYAQGVAWVVKVVAEALHYAHGQQTFHRDVKPANILLTLQHGPQLLDFNLAESPHSASQAQAAMHGGTLPYMAPEQIEAFLNPELWGKVGAQADIYSLGLVLRELLTGQAPDLPAETLAPARAMRVLLDRRPLLDVSVRRANPDIPHALEAIVAGCLEVPVEDRYPDAGALADDLDRFLTRRPLVIAVNPSRRERWTNGAIRHRRWGYAALFGLTVLMTGMAVENWRARHQPRFPLEANPDLKKAVSALDKKQDWAALEGVRLLTPMLDQYPGSIIPKVYLGLAYHGAKEHDVADRRLGEALSASNAKDQLVEWRTQDPRLPHRLERYVEGLLDRAETAPEAGDEPGENDRQGTRRDLYRLTRSILENSREIHADPELIDYDRARVEQELGEYDTVIERAEGAIRALSSRLGDKEAPKLAIYRRLYDWRRLHCRALTKRAERLRGEGPKGRLQEALEDLKLADEDLLACSSFADNESGKQALLDRHAVQKIRVACRLTRVELDIDLGQLAAAQVDLNRARKALNRYDDLAGVLKDLRDFDAKKERLNRIARRLSEAAERPSGESPPVSTQPAREAGRRDE